MRAPTGPRPGKCPITAHPCCPSGANDTTSAHRGPVAISPRAVWKVAASIGSGMATGRVAPSARSNAARPAASPSSAAPRSAFVVAPRSLARRSATNVAMCAT
jgi:hypothetical protein